MRRVVSVSLGASSRNHQATLKVGGEDFQLERVGTDGSLAKAQALIRDLDGQASAIGLGGIDLYLFAGKKRYTIRDAAKLKACAQKTPVVDGSGLKHTLERRTIHDLVQKKVLPPHAKVLLVSAVDRWGMAEAFSSYDLDIVFGDLLFGLGLPLPIRKIKTAETMAHLLLPILTRLPFSWLYPTGSKQEEHVVKFPRYFEWADVIAGDFHYIRRFLPKVSGKTIITNTVTSQDIQFLKDRGIQTLITTTPEMQGRSFGTNVLEAFVVALLEKRPEELTEKDYEEVFSRLQLQVRMEHLFPIYGEA